MNEVETKKAYPTLEPKRYDIEVYVGFYKGGGTFVTAGIIGGSHQVNQPIADLVRRYVFSVEQPAFLLPDEQDTTTPTKKDI